MFKKPGLLFFLLIISSTSFSQVQQPMSSSDIQLALKKLNTLGSVLYVAAHPDDENTRLIAYLAKERCYRTGYLSITRGDGGQNLIGTEQGEALGLVRTNELLQARKIDGGEQFFTRANDFGYSKNPEETFDIWDKEKVLGDVVWVIRNFKPDVIICRFPTTGEGGHGHHTASAMLAEEAFDAAADPNRYPEQLNFVKPWKTQRLFWNTFNFGGNNTTAADQLKIDVGIYNPLIGKGYGEIASESRSMHKSQGFGSARTRGTQIEYFKQLKGDKVTGDLFDNINTTWNSIDKSGKVSSLIVKVVKKFDPLFPTVIMQDLNDVYDAIEKLPSTEYTNRWKEKKLNETLQLITATSGVWMEAYAERNSYCSGDSIKVSAVSISRLSKIAFVQAVNAFGRGVGSLVSDSPVLNKADTMVFRSIINDSILSSNPYWLNTMHSDGLYDIPNLKYTGNPLNDDAIKVQFICDFGGHKYKIFRPVVFKSTDPVKGEIYQPLEILPPVTINFSDKAYVFSNGQEKKINLELKANTNNANVTLSFSGPDKWLISSPDISYFLKNKGDEQTATISIKPTSADDKTYQLKANANINNKIISNSITRIEYDHIPHQVILSDASVKLLNLDVKTAKKKIGYIEGAGDNVSECLQQMGYDVTALTDEKLTNENLHQYQTIVTGVRAYNTNERLQVHYDKLMQYINDGGTLLVQYNTNSRIGPVKAKIGPYPFNISRDRVTNENAAVTILNPSHKIMTTPNKITSKDFTGWIQERGIYFSTERDSNYIPLLEMNDPGEKPLNGSILVADYGKGHFIYTGLALFRELPAGVAGAYRLFANLVEY